MLLPMTTTAHTRRKARKLATAKRTAIAAIVARNLSSQVTPKGFAPNGLATSRQPWGDHGVRIGQNVRGETAKVKPTFIAIPQGERHAWPVISSKVSAGAAYVRNLQSKSKGEQSE
jgi:hypothetical protein